MQYKQKLINSFYEEKIYSRSDVAWCLMKSCLMLYGQRWFNRTLIRRRYSGARFSKNLRI